MSRGFGAAFAAENHLSHGFKKLDHDGGAAEVAQRAGQSQPLDRRRTLAYQRSSDDDSPGLEAHEDDLLAEFKPVKDTVNKVNLSGMSLATLPNFKPNQLEAQILWINDNNIASLPAGIKQLSKLRTLRLDDNQIQIIPSLLASCRQLEILTAKRNKIHQLSLDIFDLQFIKVLDFEDNALTFLPELRSFALLERLSVTKNRLTKLPESIGGCCRLDSLYADNNRIQEIHFTYEQLLELRLVNLAHNEMCALDPSIGCCSSLEILHLHYNHLITLPYTIGLLTKLTRLTLHDNPSVGIPKQVLSAGIDVAVDFLKKMLDANEKKQIWLNNMHLYTVPLPNVSQVQEFATWRRIRVLNLDRNELHNLPVELCVLDELEVLSVEHNLLTTVTPTLMQLSRLQVLAVGNNKIQSLPQSLKKLIQLEELLLETNSLTSVPIMLPSLISLTDLRFDNNRVASLPPEMANLQMLQILSFQNNVVDSIPPSFTSLHRLAFLRCGSNKIADVRSRAVSRQFFSLTFCLSRFTWTCVV
jgi:Leucine-rich repeat (LRR) protein